MNILRQIATAAGVAFVVYAGKDKSASGEKVNLKLRPVQVVSDIFMVDSENGVLKMRMEADVMERYEQDTVSFELFPDGFHVFSYNESGLLESTIDSDQASHYKYKDGRETWQAFGNVVIKNVINREVMETDTLYWDQENEIIHTDCYVRMYSPDGFMQGYGMESDQKARNSVILRPFNSYGLVEKDTTEVVIDSVNFIGPMAKK
ncbi:MAG: LPS export ABC transporter periplasmic protein LptC [Bacteroidales bacterium]|nr:LPS export ABC transporter periplasmic protein LptC [Bacteroidales bacterium]